jgi:hypothetical protein
MPRIYALVILEQNIGGECIEILKSSHSNKFTVFAYKL